MKSPIIGTGLSGVVGSRLVELLQDEYDFEDLSLESGVDITNTSQLKRLFAQSTAKVCLHLAAVTDVDGCEQQKDLGRESLAWQVNVQATRSLAQLAREKDMHMVYISTEFVFDGTKPIGEVYSEEDEPRPVNWYGETKYQG